MSTFRVSNIPRVLKRGPLDFGFFQEVWGIKYDMDAANYLRKRLLDLAGKKGVSIASTRNDNNNKSTTATTPLFAGCSSVKVGLSGNVLNSGLLTCPNQRAKEHLL